MPLFLISIFIARLPQGITNLGFTLSIVASRCALHVFMSVGDMSASRTPEHFTEAARANSKEVQFLSKSTSCEEKGVTSPYLYFRESERNRTSA